MTPAPLRVLSYNIHKGLGLGNRSFVLPAIREALATSQADVVFLQEVVGQHDKHAQRFDAWPDIPQHQFLAGSDWPHVAYGKNAVYAHGHHGNAILSRFPIVEVENIDVSTNPLESRGILHAVLDIPGMHPRVHCMCVHLNILQRGRDLQIQRLVRRVVQWSVHSEPLIVAGDFNDWQERASQQLFEALELREVFERLTGGHALSFPTVYPLLKLDRLYIRAFTPLTAAVLNDAPWNGLSDHAPIRAELELRR
jgi:endonuclease/exonuclease/phosphatase family metal-dependent hydrolase